MITAIDTNTALVLIDLQKGIVKHPTVHPIRSVLANVVRLRDVFRKEHLPVVIVNVNPLESTSGEVRTDRPSTATADARTPHFLDIVDEINITQDDIRITKHTWSAFHETTLHDELKKRNITGIVLAGISTGIGVEGTARSASERGYNISFAADAMTDRILECHEHSIRYIFPRIGEVGTSDEIISALMQRK